MSLVTLACRHCGTLNHDVADTDTDDARCMHCGSEDLVEYFESQRLYDLNKDAIRRWAEEDSWYAERKAEGDPLPASYAPQLTRKQA